MKWSDQQQEVINIGTYMSACVLLNLLNKLS